MLSGAWPFAWQMVKYTYGGCSPACHRYAQALAGRSMLEMYYTYVLQSRLDGNLYVGFSNNLKGRLKQHLSGIVPATKYRLPLELVYYEACLSKKNAVAREKYLKTGFGRRFLKSRI